MKPLFRTLLMLSVLLVLSCRGDEEYGGQKIDQVLRIYLENDLGEDLLDPSREPAPYGVSFIDLEAVRAGATVSAQKKEDSIKGNYLEYIAGATRVLESESGEEKTYRSSLQMITQAAQSAPEQIDTLTLRYHSTPRDFALSEVLLGQSVLFSKSGQEINEIVIKK